MMTCVGSVANKRTAPFVPAGTIAALALIRPSNEFRVETTGCDWPVGQAERKPSEPDGTTVRFKEYARALAGIPQALAGIAKSRKVPPAKMGPPRGPLGSRVSATRHGVTGTTPRACAAPT